MRRRLSKQFLRAIAVFSATALLSTAALADAALSDALGKCKRIANDAERLICFDAVAAMVGDGSTTDETPDTTAQPTPDVMPLTDEIGKERVAGAKTEEAPKYAGTVTRCEESRQSGQTYFFFENGQVWKQANYRRLNLRNCRFDVTVAKDTFGYELHIPSKDRRVRVSRVR